MKRSAVTRKLFGVMPIGISDPKTLHREMKLGAGKNVTSDRRPVRYQQDEAAARIYRAEQNLRRDYAAMDPSPELRFADIPAVQAYVNEVLSWPWPAKPWACQVRPTDKPYPHYRSAIFLPAVPKAMRELVVLHELAHHISRIPDHELAFRRTFEALLADAMGLQARELFQRYLRAEGVSV
jgi:putative metallohydrolase (TIGR04338 family)